MIHPVESALPSRAARIQQGGDETKSAEADGMAFYESVLLYIMILLKNRISFRLKMS